MEHHSFFRLQSPKTAGRKFSLLGLSSKFRYSGRTEFQTVSETALASNQAKSRWERAFFRSPSRRVLRQTMPNLEKSRNILASPEHSSIGETFHTSDCERPPNPDYLQARATSVTPCPTVTSNLEPTLSNPTLAAESV